jgi:hypothetical protein
LIANVQSDRLLNSYQLKGVVMRLFFLLIANVGVGVALVGCGSAPTVAPNAYVPSIQVIHLPQVNVDAEAEIGQTIISTANLSSKAAVTLARDVSEYRKADLLNNRWSGTTSLRAGTFEKRFENADGSFFQDDKATFTFPAGGVRDFV